MWHTEEGGIVRAPISGMSMKQMIEIDLSGEWIGYYPSHFDEVIRITQNDNHVEAVKVTGDDYVPAGSVTWRADLRTGRGEGQVAEHGYRNAVFIPGSLTIVNDERIVFTWQNVGSVEYRKDD